MDRPAWAQLGYEQQFLDRVAELESQDAEDWTCDPPASFDGEAIYDWANEVNTCGTRVVAMGCTGYAISHPPLDDWRDAGHRVVAAALYCLLGAWRDRFEWRDGEHIDRAKARAKLPWIDLYRYALPFALSLGDWKSADQLLEWPGPDLPFDEGLDDLTEEDNAYQIWLASRLRGEPLSASAPQLAAVVGGTRKRPKLAQATAQALLDKDPVAFTQALTETVARKPGSRSHALRGNAVLAALRPSAVNGRRGASKRTFPRGAWERDRLPRFAREQSIPPRFPCYRLL